MYQCRPSRLNACHGRAHVSQRTILTELGERRSRVRRVSGTNCNPWTRYMKARGGRSEGPTMHGGTSAGVRAYPPRALCPPCAKAQCISPAEPAADGKGAHQLKQMLELLSGVSLPCRGFAPASSYVIGMFSNLPASPSARVSARTTRKNPFRLAQPGPPCPGAQPVHLTLL